MGLGFWALQTKRFILGLPHGRERESSPKRSYLRDKEIYVNLPLLKLLILKAQFKEEKNKSCDDFKVLWHWEMRNLISVTFQILSVTCGL